MPTPERPLRRIEEELSHVRDQVTALALADGVIDAEERRPIDALSSICAELIAGDAIMTNGLSAALYWEPLGSPRSQRRLREVQRDLPSLALGIA